ncbi:MAG: pectate lyase [Ignavibacteriales bacterium]|nr:MAG: pectate lyase [Ignavibacteriales bacterium]
MGRRAFIVKFYLIPIICFSFIILVSGFTFSQTKKNSTDTISFNVEYFYDSAHHWYDIREEERVINPDSDQKRYDVNEIEKIADNILLFQKENGGWSKNYDMLAVLTNAQREAVEKSKGDINTTFDNGTTFSQVDYLARTYHVTGDKKYLDGFTTGINFILTAQYDNGGWPQFYPDTSGYRKYITFNDGAMLGIMKVLHNIVEKEYYYSFVDEELYSRVSEAYNRGIDCILKCQIFEDGKLTAWCQQHDNIDFSPRPARTFEPAAICNGESSEIVELLMKIKNPDREIIAAIQGAVKWFYESKISGIKVVTIEAPETEYLYHTSSDDRIVVPDESANPIWTRFYELGTHVPMFCKRTGEIVYSLDQVERERRTGYAWYIYQPQEILDSYPEWQMKWITEENILPK